MSKNMSLGNVFEENVQKSVKYTVQIIFLFHGLYLIYRMFTHFKWHTVTFIFVQIKMFCLKLTEKWFFQNHLLLVDHSGYQNLKRTMKKCSWWPLLQNQNNADSNNKMFLDIGRGKRSCTVVVWWFSIPSILGRRHL